MIGKRWLVLSALLFAVPWVLATAPAQAGGPVLALGRPNVAGPQAAVGDLSSQARRERRRAPTRIEVRPLRGPLHRACVPVFEERWIPQWGGRVLYASQRCWWTGG
ncbi:MAG: hypothetical protein IRZ09_07450 [Variibacter sp.]|nr:hypothetical protein [Variibacter sp.]